LEGINSTIWNGIENNLGSFFDGDGSAKDKIVAMLELPVEKYSERQNISEDLVKKQLFWHGKQEVFNIVTRLSRVERIVMELDEKLRDHIVHAMVTYLLGIFLYSKLKHDHSIHNFPFQWKFSGPLHDIAYPIEIFENLSKSWLNEVYIIKENIQEKGEKDPNGCKPIFDKIKLGGKNSFEIIRNLDNLQNELSAIDYIQRQMNSWQIELDPEDYISWLKNERICDHGAIGSIVLLNILDFIYQAHNPTRKREFTPYGNNNFNQEIFENDLVASVSAIFVHNIHNNYLKKNKIKIVFV